jgi:hypothetical protein
LFFQRLPGNRCLGYRQHRSQRIELLQMVVPEQGQFLTIFDPVVNTSLLHFKECTMLSQNQRETVSVFNHPDPLLLETLHQMESIDIFNSLHPTTLEKLAQLTHKKLVREGEYIFREGEPAYSLYSVIKGKVALEIAKDSSTPVRVKDIFPNQCFGLSAIVEFLHKKCIFSARALQDSQLLSWKAEALEKLFMEDQQAGILVYRTIAKILKDRLRDKNAQFVSGL